LPEEKSNEIENLFSLSCLRKRLNLTLKQVSNFIGISVPSLISLEKDSSKLTFEKAEKFAELYRCPKEKIFYGEEKIFNKELQKRGGFYEYDRKTHNG
jgi:transcriptional regulator with XRE-family HTH domain